MTAPTDELSRELRPPRTAEAAVDEADRCLECGGGDAHAPCRVGCPAGIDVPSFVAAIAAGDVAAAAQSIFAENILGGTCARVCPVEVLCQRLALPEAVLQKAAVAVMSGTAPPPSLTDLMPRIAPRSTFLIYAGRGAGGEELQPHY